MTHAKSETRALRRHLYNFHGFDRTAGLSYEQLCGIHSDFHVDGWQTRPHTHPADSDGCEVEEEEFDVQTYFTEVIEANK